MSNQTEFKTGSNQSGIGKPHTGPLAFAHSAAHIAAKCPIVETWPEGLRYKVARMRFEAEGVIAEIEAYRKTGVQE